MIFDNLYVTTYLAILCFYTNVNLKRFTGYCCIFKHKQKNFEYVRRCFQNINILEISRIYWLYCDSFLMSYQHLKFSIYIAHHYAPLFTPVTHYILRQTVTYMR